MIPVWSLTLSPGNHGLANKALKLTQPAKERAPRHSAVQHGAPCRVARSSLMWASQLNAVLDGPFTAL
jgi:hypothetical protein